MIIRKVEGELICTLQNDHGHESGVLAGYWGNEEFARPAGFEPLVDACFRHDEAWRFLDELPTVDKATGEPYSFLSMPLLTRLQAYRHGAERVAETNPYGGFLVSMHYEGFFNQRFGLDPGLMAPMIPKEDEQAMRSFFSMGQVMRTKYRVDAAQRQGIACSFETAPLPRHAYLILQVVDAISLFLCLDSARTWPLGAVPLSTSGPTVELMMRPGAERGVVEIDPWPFERGRVIRLAFPTRRVADRRYVDDSDLRRAFSAGVVERVLFDIVGK
jgi:hypothetical protein